ncbi:MAG: hypothetical protein QOJ91_2686 [Sphingomonadales bacterium]|jgi:hypothetical protein|nr:hypothetical protein [Sphingomonadales bacterium]
MHNRYSITAGQAFVCRAAAGLCWTIALVQLGALLFAIAVPSADLRARCGAAGCTAATVPHLPITPEQVAAAGVRPATPEAILARIGRPAVRLPLAALDVAGQLPFVGFLLCVALGLWRLSGRSDGAVARALPWLFRAALFALIYALVSPLAQIARLSLLLSALEGGTVFFAELDLKAAAINLLLSFIAFTATWALASGHRARRELAEIV